LVGRLHVRHDGDEVRRRRGVGRDLGADEAARDDAEEEQRRDRDAREEPARRAADADCDRRDALLLRRPEQDGCPREPGSDLGALLAGRVSAAPAPTYTIAFHGSGAEHQVDSKQNVEDDGSCEAAEHVDVNATVAWSASWTRFRPAGRTTLGAPPQIAGSRVQ